MKIHIVQRGETLWSIAEKHPVSFEEVKKLNAHLANPDMIVPGMKIKLPDTAMMPSKKEHPYADKKPMACPPQMEEAEETEPEQPMNPPEQFMNPPEQFTNPEEFSMPENWMTEPVPAPVPHLEEPDMMMPCPPVPCYFFPVPFPMPMMPMMPNVGAEEGADRPDTHSMPGISPMPESQQHPELHHPSYPVPRCPYCHW